MQRRFPQFPLLLVLTSGLLAALPAQRASSSELRRTAIVKAVQAASPSVVNIRGEKTVNPAGGVGRADQARRVNGLGTGVVIDERGYIITNHHVVLDVQKIHVTLSDQRRFIARIVSYDREADLAIIKIDCKEKLPVIKIGTSSDLLLGETVVAVGNPYGYEHSITRGVISALHRTVPVTDSQTYADLIQTDASINPGNSGGPLLNVDGEMIGIAVAVRAGAQGIGFAIPVDRAMQVAAQLLRERPDNRTWHGVTTAARCDTAHPGIEVRGVAAGSPAARCDLKVGDVITAIDDATLRLPLDLERALLDRKPGEAVRLTVRRGDRLTPFRLVLAEAPDAVRMANDPNWRALGMRLAPVSPEQFRRFRTRYRGGLRVTDVRPGGPAGLQGVRPGDVLLGMHIWETISLENIAYILGRPDFRRIDPMKFYILRGDQTLYGHMQVAAQR